MVKQSIAAASVKQLIVKADDFGTHPDINHGIHKAVMAKRISAVSVMINGHIFPSEIRFLKKARVGLGLHIDLGKRETWNNYLSPVKRKKVLDQIQKFKYNFGFKPMHIDGHYNVHLEDKDVFSCVIEFARENDIYVRGRGEYINVLKRLGIRTCDYFLDSLREEPAKLLANAKEGLNELMMHPGFYYPGTEYPDSLTKDRQRDLDFLLSNEFEDILKQNGIELV